MACKYVHYSPKLVYDIILNLQGANHFKHIPRGLLLNEWGITETDLRKLCCCNYQNGFPPAGEKEFEADGVEFWPLDRRIGFNEAKAASPPSELPFPCGLQWEAMVT